MSHFPPKHDIELSMTKLRVGKRVEAGTFVQVRDYPEIGGRSSTANDAEAAPRNPGMALERGGPQVRKGGPI